MDWLKRNLFLVVAAAVALGLLGFAVYYLYSNRANDAQVTQQLDQAIAELQLLHNSDPTPSTNNIAILEREQRRLNTFIADTRKRFATPTEVKIDNQSFKKLLEDTIFDLTREAEGARVTLPPNRYSFTFEIQRRAVKFAPGSLDPLVVRMEEIKSLCSVIFAAKVHSLDGLRRVSVSTDDTEGNADFLLQKPMTNVAVGMMEIPYEVTFTGFSAQLASVFDGLARAPQFFLVKNVTVEAAQNTGPARGAPVDPDAPPVPEGAPPPAAVPAFTPPGRSPAGAAKAGPVTLLNEKLLRITLALQVVVPAPAAPATAAVPGPK